MQATSRYHKTKEQLLIENDHVEAAKKNPAKFDVLYRKYHEPIFRYVYQRMDDKELAFDVTSQVFMKALTNLHRYQFRGVPFASWLYRIAKSEVYKSFKETNAKRTVNIESVHIYGMIDEFEDLGDIQDRERLKQKLIQAIAELPELDLQIVEMRHFEKRSFREIGEILDLTENNAKVRAYRILGRLRKEFAKD